MCRAAYSRIEEKRELGMTNVTESLSHMPDASIEEFGRTMAPSKRVKTMTAIP
jgi:hypothetical protein